MIDSSNTAPPTAPQASTSNNKALEPRTDAPVAMPTPVVYTRDQHPVSRSKIDSDALKIMYRLMRHGYKAYMVGGGVRDLLLGKKPKDFDISTDATPRKIKEIFRNSRIIGKRFKLVHVFFRGGKIIEVSTFRDFTDPIEVDENDAERAPSAHKPIRDNKYGTEVTDALRRDLTINGLFYDLATFSIIDYVGGVRDLGEGVIRIIGDPTARFIEDAVRMIRAVRHAARSDFKLDDACRNAIKQNKALILQSSSMRVFEELKKDFLSGYSLKILRLLAESELLGLLIPELSHDGASYLQGDNALTQALARADQARVEGLELSATTVLAIMLIFSCTASASGEIATIAELPEKLESLGDLLEVVRSSFTSLAVPKREKEKMEELIHALITVISVGTEEINPGTLARKACFTDLKNILHCLNSDKSLTPIIELLDTVSEEELDSLRRENARNAPPRGRYRGRGGPPHRGGGGEGRGGGGGRGFNRRRGGNFEER